MKYLVMVSHGKFASGLENALSMLSGKREDVFAVGLEDGKTADEFAQLFKTLIEPITAEDEIILLGDLIGGSPMTTAMNVLEKCGFLSHTTVMGGMNLPLALTTVLMKDTLDKKTLVTQVTEEAKSALRELVIETEDEDDDI